DYRKPGARTDDVLDVSALGLDYLEPQLFTTDFAPLPVSRPANGASSAPAVLEETSDDDADDALRKPQVGLVIRDQLRRVEFEPSRLWRPPLDSPHSIDDLVDAHLGRAWQSDYAAAGDLVFPVGLIDRPYKHDQRPLLVDAAGE